MIVTAVQIRLFPLFYLVGCKIMQIIYFFFLVYSHLVNLLVSLFSAYTKKNLTPCLIKSIKYLLNTYYTQETLCPHAY